MMENNILYPMDPSFIPNLDHLPVELKNNFPKDITAFFHCKIDYFNLNFKNFSKRYKDYFQCQLQSVISQPQQIIILNKP